MSDAIRIERGRQPWLPAADTELVEVFRRYDAPLEGIVAQHGLAFLFRCLVGEIERFSIWGYGSLDDAERARLSAAATHDLDELEAAIWRSDRPITVAFATDDYGVLDSVAFDGPLTSDKLLGLDDLLSQALDRRVAEVRSDLEAAAASLQALVL